MTSEERTEKREEIREKSGERRSAKRKERRVQREEERKESDRAGPYLPGVCWSFYTPPLHPENNIHIRQGKRSGGLDTKNIQKTKTCVEKKGYKHLRDTYTGTSSSAIHAWAQNALRYMHTSAIHAPARSPPRYMRRHELLRNTCLGAERTANGLQLAFPAIPHARPASGQYQATIRRNLLIQ